MKRKNKGMSFDSWLDEEGIREEVTAAALKRVLARQIAAAMKRDGITKTEMARRMRASRSTLGRLLDEQNGSVALATLCKAASAVGREVCLDLVYGVERGTPPGFRFPRFVRFRRSFLPLRTSPTLWTEAGGKFYASPRKRYE